MLSTATMTPSLPPISTILPLRNELAMTFTASPRLAALESAAPYRSSGCTLVISSSGRGQGYAGRFEWFFAVLGAPRPCRPPAGLAGAGPDRGGFACLFFRKRFRRCRDRSAAGLARQRDSFARLRHAHCARRHAVTALPAHLAGIRLQEDSGRRRVPHRRVR